MGASQWGWGLGAGDWAQLSRLISNLKLEWRDAKRNLVCSFEGEGLEGADLRQQRGRVVGYEVPCHLPR